MISRSRAKVISFQPKPPFIFLYSPFKADKDFKATVVKRAFLIFQWRAGWHEITWHFNINIYILQAKRQAQDHLLLDEDDPTLNNPALDLEDSDADDEWTPIKEKVITGV